MPDPIHTTALAVASSDWAEERLAVSAFLAGYRTNTREGYAFDLTQWFGFCRSGGVRPFTVRRAHIELFGREMESRGLKPATVSRRLSTVCCWYKYLVAEDMVSKNPAVYVRRPKVSSESTTLGLDRAEMGRMLWAAEAGRPTEHALVCLLALNGLRVSEACGSLIEDLGNQRGHRTLSIIGKGNKLALIPLAPRTARAIDLAVAGRTSGHIILDSRGQPCSRGSAAWIITKLARRAQILHHVHPHSLRHAFVTAALDAGAPLRDVQESARHADPRMTMRYDRARGNLDRNCTYIVAAFVAGAA